jgi:uncharacterized protein
MECRPNCAACCIAPSISSSIPGMPKGKPAFVPCIQLSTDLKCKLFGDHKRPKVCLSLNPSREMCGLTTEEAFAFLKELEELTKP